MFTIDDAQRIATSAHDRTGKLYGHRRFIVHPTDVVRLVCEMFPEVSTAERTLLIILAWLHDVVEDTDVTIAELRALGCPTPVLYGLDAITRRPPRVETYAQYIARLCRNRLALMVKVADNQSNQDHLDDIPDTERREGLRRRYRKNRVTLDLAAADLNFDTAPTAAS